MKNSKGKLQRSQELFQLLVEEIKDNAILILDPKGNVVTWNAGAERLKGYKAEEVLGKHFSIFFTQEDIRQGKPQVYLKEAEHKGSLKVEEWRIRKDGSRFWADVVITPLHDHEGHHLGFVKIVRDLTQRREMEEKLRLSIRAFKILSHCNQTVIRASHEEKLIKDTCHIIVETGKYRMAWVGYAERDEARSVRPIASAGHGADYLNNTHITWADTKWGRGPTGTAIRTGEPVYVQDIETDPRFKPWRKAALTRGYHSSIALPLIVEGEVLGTLNIYASKPNAFSEEEIELLKELASDLAFGIHVIRAREAKKKTEQEKEKLLLAVEQASDMIYITDREGAFLYANKAVEEVSGYSPGELVGTHVRIWQSGSHDEHFYQELWETILSGRPYRAAFINKRKNGQLFYLDQTITPVRDATGDVSLFVATGKDISQETLLKERIHRLAYYDALTGLPNKSLFMERVKQGLSSCPPEKLAAIAIVNISKFRRINDLYGYDTGNHVLQEVGRRLSLTAGKKNTIARIGGSEYGLFLGRVGHVKEVMPVLQSIRESIAKVEADGRKIGLEINMGVSVFPHDTREPGDLFEKARMALSEAKSKGTPYQFYSKEAEEMAREFALMEERVTNAWERRAYLLHYQPYFDITTEEIAGMEALLRLRTEEGDVVSAGMYIPILEETKMILDVGAWAFQEACRQLIEWRNKGHSLVPVSVNVSPIQFSHKGLLDTIGGTLKESGVDPEFLTMEITESTFMKDIEHTKRVLRTFREWGMSVSIDDFGTGYSSLSYLKRFPIDNLKIDISFIRNITHDPDDASIVSAIIALARDLGLKTIAEGVETEEQWRFLRLLRCDMVQGFYSGRPMPPHEAEKALEEGTFRPSPPVT